MKQTIHSLIVLVIVCLCAFYAYTHFFTNTIGTDVKSYDRKIDSIQVHLDSISKENTKLKLEVDSLVEKSTQVDTKIIYVDRNISNIKQQRNEKIQSINLYTPSELELFLTDWARLHKDSIR